MASDFGVVISCFVGNLSKLSVIFSMYESRALSTLLFFVSVQFMLEKGFN